MFKAGYKTTEFWVTVTLVLVGLNIAITGFAKGGWVAVAAVAAVPAGCTLGGNDVLDKYFKGSAYTAAAWYLGLKGAGSVVARWFPSCTNRFLGILPWWLKDNRGRR